MSPSTFMLMRWSSTFCNSSGSERFSTTKLSRVSPYSLKPAFTEYGLTLDSFVVENLSLPDELQKVLDQRISMNVLGDMGKFTQYQVAQAIPIAAANEGGGAVGMGAGLGAGVAMGQAMMDAVKKSTSAPAGGT